MTDETPVVTTSYDEPPQDLYSEDARMVVIEPAEPE